MQIAPPRPSGDRVRGRGAGPRVLCALSRIWDAGEVGRAVVGWDARLEHLLSAALVPVPLGQPATPLR